MINVKRHHKLCQTCKSSYKTSCVSPSCKYTIDNYKNQSAYMKLKTINYFKETKQEFYLCRLCQQIVSREHFETQEHIDLFNSVVDIEINQSLKNSFLSIKTMFMNTNYNTIYTDLYFKKRIKEITLKNIDVTKYYKAYILKKNMLSFNFRDEEQFILKNIIVMIL